MAMPAARDRRRERKRMKRRYRRRSPSPFVNPNSSLVTKALCNRLFTTVIILGMRKGLALFEFACLVVMMDCARSGCDNEAPSDHVSPDGQWKYVSFDRNCGATTGTNLQISVLPASKSLPSDAANAFIADDNHSATRFVAQPQWLSSRK